MTLGVLDWGIGGFWLVQALRRREPSVDVLYQADTGATPYGLCTRRELTARVARGLAQLRARGADQLVVACHSASTVLEQVDEPAQGVIVAPPLAAGCRVGVLGGARTVRSQAWRRALAGHVVQQRIAQPLSAAVEAGRADHPDTDALVRRVVAPMKVDVILLCCTHYAALAATIAAHAGVETVDPALHVARAVPLAPGAGRLEVHTTGDARSMAATLARLGFSAGVQRVRWPDGRG